MSGGDGDGGREESVELVAAPMKFQCYCHPCDVREIELRLGKKSG